MRLLLDTHILIALARQELATIDASAHAAIMAPLNTSYVSAATLWEIAIKTRLRKLDPGMSLDDLAEYFVAIGLAHLAINHRHAVHEIVPVPPTRDPFDQLLLAQCAVEGLRLVTNDRILAQHPLAWAAA
ncbi:MAG TPA: type II toxin-antitoxin system VapC family toxin [Rhizomicrobium sp.]|jgi:PIN domain nuclease of toxin-antitoxin system